MTGQCESCGSGNTPFIRSLEKLDSDRSQIKQNSSSLHKKLNRPFDVLSLSFSIWWPVIHCHRIGCVALVKESQVSETGEVWHKYFCLCYLSISLSNSIFLFAVVSVFASLNFFARPFITSAVVVPGCFNNEPWARVVCTLYRLPFQIKLID